MRKIIKNTVILTLITLIAGLSLAYVYSITMAPIEQSAKNAQNSAYQVVFAAAAKFTPLTVSEYSDENNAKVYEVNEALDSSGKKIGFVLTTAAKGYGGDIKIAMGIQTDGAITEIAILDDSKETAGLGTKIEEKWFISQFSKRKDTTVVLSDIDAVSGATFSTKGVLHAVNAGLTYYSQHLKEGG